MIFFRQLRHLLPRAKAWSLTIDKQLRQFFDGLSILGSDFKVFVDDVYDDLFPNTTRELDAWEAQFGLTDPVGLTTQQRRDRIDAAWKEKDGQSPRFIQDALQAAGFNVFLHFWFVPGTEPAVDVKACATARDPADFVAEGNFLVNKIIVTSPLFLAVCGEAGAQCGEADIQCGNFRVLKDVPTVFPAPTDPAKFPYVLYIGAETFPGSAQLDITRRQEFEALLLQICPAQQWLGLLVNDFQAGADFSKATGSSLDFTRGSFEAADFANATGSSLDFTVGAAQAADFANATGTTGSS